MNIIDAQILELDLDNLTDQELYWLHELKNVAAKLSMSQYLKSKRSTNVEGA